MLWQTTRFGIDLSRPRIMGIVNLTPDSFSDGGCWLAPGDAILHCERMLKAGADILDLGGESSRPGAQAVDPQEEWRRVQPVLQEVLSWNCPVSLDTTKPDLMRRALAMGVDIINDIQALRLPGALDAVAASARCGVCLMHMQGLPEAMQVQPQYEDVLGQVGAFLADRARIAQKAGIDAKRIVLDPGIGFGKSVAHNLALLRCQDALRDLGFPLLVGWSRKSTLGALTGRDAAQRMAASLAAALAAVSRGARVLRVHDVAETADALKVWAAAGLVPASSPQ